MKPQIHSNVQTKLMTIAMVLLAIEQCKANNSPYCIIDMQALEAAASATPSIPQNATQLLASPETPFISCTHFDTAQALQQIHQELQERNLALKVLRSPYSKHHDQPTCSCTVDVTLMTQEGYELLMPTDYQADSKNNDKLAHKNYELLRAAMNKHGFEQGNHWWEYAPKSA